MSLLFIHLILLFIFQNDGQYLKKVNQYDLIEYNILDIAN